jgi:hypothetical protein
MMNFLTHNHKIIYIDDSERLNNNHWQLYNYMIINSWQAIRDYMKIQTLDILFTDDCKNQKVQYCLNQTIDESPFYEQELRCQYALYSISIIFIGCVLLLNKS